MNGQFSLSDYMEKLRRTQELPIQQLPEAQPEAISSEKLQMPQIGAQFGQPVGDERMKLTDTNLAGPEKGGTGVPANVTKAAIDAVGGTIQSLAQSAFMQEEGRKATKAEAMSAEAKSKAKSAAETGAQQFGGLANLMDVYRGVYGGRRR